MKNIKTAVWIPIIVAVAFICGLFSDRMLNSRSGRTETEQKLSNMLNIIANDYVDKVNIDSLLEATFPSLLANLDPHSVYIPAEELANVNSELEGSFSGVGIQFNISNDTIQVVEAIADGPAERVGIKAGDRIISVNAENVAGVGITNEEVFKKLRGEKNTKVTLTIKRNGASAPLNFDVVRGDIPITSIDASYMISPTVGYVKVNKFGRTTYEEFFNSLVDLVGQGAEGFIVDLRGNTGGLMEAAVLMVNEFLPAGFTIVETRGRHKENDEIIRSDGYGYFRGYDLAVLMDEYSASASEIFAGAIQDNDRGLVIGRRSFGKGLVQNQIDLPDKSAIRLTVARYYTPSGRSIQKDYSDAYLYETEIYDRYESGEAFDPDSIKFDENLRYETLTGRTVYGGGGIMPDVYIPNDTTGVTKYYLDVANAGHFNSYALNYADNNRIGLETATSTEELLSMLPHDDLLLRSFVDYCAKNGHPARWYYINISKPLIVNQLKALIARDILGIGAYYEVNNLLDKNVLRAIEEIEAGNALPPILPPQPDAEE